MPLSLSDRDNTPKPSSYGHDFHHAEPQRRVPCALGDMLAPRSADDIPPITPAAMESVQEALELLANLVGDRDLGRFLGDNDDRLNAYQVKARDIQLAARGLAGILRVQSAKAEAAVHELRLCEQEGLVLSPGQLYHFTVDENCKRCRELAADYRARTAAETVASSLSDDQGKAIMSRLDQKQEDAFKAAFKAAVESSATCDQQSARQQASAEVALKVLAEQEADRVEQRHQLTELTKKANEAPVEVELSVRLTKAELGALRQALDHVRVHMAHQHSWEVRDTAMVAIGKVLKAARKD